MMTVHAAKGLEFPYVFLCAMNEGIFPSRKVKTLPGMEEERRLAFVAMTRAQKQLYLSEAEGRNLDGSPRYPSRFVLDIDQALLEYTAPPKDLLIKEARDYIQFADQWLKKDANPVTYSKGQRVQHMIFGKGTIIDTDPVKKAHIIQFDDMETPRAISFKAKLETADS